MLVLAGVGVQVESVAPVVALVVALVVATAVASASVVGPVVAPVEAPVVVPALDFAKFALVVVAVSASVDVVG